MNRLVIGCATLLLVLIQAGFDAFPPGDLCLCTAACRATVEESDCCGRPIVQNEPDSQHAPNCPEKCPNCIRVQLPEHNAVIVRRAAIDERPAIHWQLPAYDLPFLFELSRPVLACSLTPPTLISPQLASIRSVRLLV